MISSVSKIITKVSLSIFFCLTISFTVIGQTTALVSETKKNANGNESNAIHIFLEPLEKQDSIEIADSCLVLLRDIQGEMNLALGEPSKITFPAGTKFLVSKGKYKIENSNSFSIEYVLKNATQCKQR